MVGDGVLLLLVYIPLGSTKFIGVYCRSFSLSVLFWLYSKKERSFPICTEVSFVTKLLIWTIQP